MSFQSVALIAIAVTTTAGLAVGVGQSERKTETPFQSHAYSAADLQTGPTQRVFLTNRLTDARCVLERQGRNVRTVGACAGTFSASHRIHGWRAGDNGVTLVDPMGSSVLDFAWDEETGMSSVATPVHAETGKLALEPIVTR